MWYFQIKAKKKKPNKHRYLTFGRENSQKMYLETLQMPHSWSTTAECNILSFFIRIMELVTFTPWVYWWANEAIVNGTFEDPTVSCPNMKLLQKCCQWKWDTFMESQEKHFWRGWSVIGRFIEIEIEACPRFMRSHHHLSCCGKSPVLIRPSVLIGPVSRNSVSYQGLVQFNFCLPLASLVCFQLHLEGHSKFPPHMAHK